MKQLTQRKIDTQIDSKRDTLSKISIWLSSLVTPMVVLVDTAGMIQDHLTIQKLKLDSTSPIGTNMP